MIFASDLDQTLIYSINFLRKKYEDPEKLLKDKLSIIEYYEGEPLSYIHKDTVSGLKDLDNNGCFVPVTTRTEEQYKRVDFSRFGVNPQYAVTTNGAKVLRDGAIDEEWESRVRQKLAKITFGAGDISELIKNNISPEAIKKIRTAEDIFSYCVLFREVLNINQVDAIREQLKPEGWEVSLQGTKLYFMPGAISKWDAVAYVCSKLGDDQVVSAGDSLLDLPLLQHSGVGLVPGHGEIFNQDLHKVHELEFCGKEGVEASVAIVDKVRTCMLSKDARREE